MITLHEEMERLCVIHDRGSPRMVQECRSTGCPNLLSGDLGTGQEPVPASNPGLYACSHGRTTLCGTHVTFNALSPGQVGTAPTRDHVLVTSQALWLTSPPLPPAAPLTSLQPPALWLLLVQSDQCRPASNGLLIPSHSDVRFAPTPTAAAEGHPPVPLPTPQALAAAGLYTLAFQPCLLLQGPF